MPTKSSARSDEGLRPRPPVRKLTPRTITYNTHTGVITSCTGSRSTHGSTLANREGITSGNSNRGITDNTVCITNANTQRVTYTTLSNTTASSTILTIRATGGTTT